MTPFVQMGFKDMSSSLTVELSHNACARWQAPSLSTLQSLMYTPLSDLLPRITLAKVMAPFVPMELWVSSLL